MSRKTEPTLHVEWSPACVTAVDILTGQTVTAQTLSGLGPIVNGHRQVLVGISRSQVFLKTLRLPKADPDDLRRILSVQMAQFFPLPPSQLSFDCIQTHDRTAEGFLTVVGAVRTDDLKQLRDDLKQSNLTASRILPVALGSAAVAARSGLPDALVIEHTASGLALDVVQDGVLRFSRIVPIESDPAAEAQRTLAAARVDSLTFITTPKVSVPGALAGEGTALSRLHESPPFRFELSEDLAREAKRHSSGRTRLATLMLAASLLLVTLIWADRSDDQAKVNKGAATWARELKKLRSIRDSETIRAQNAASIAATLKLAFEPGQALSDTAGVVSESLPPGAWLTGVSVERGKPLQVRGTALNADDVAQFTRALGSTPRLRDVKLIYTNSAKIEDKPVVQFNVSAFPVGNLPMPEPQKKAAKTKKKAPASTDTSKVEAAR